MKTKKTQYSVLLFFMAIFLTPLSASAQFCNDNINVWFGTPNVTECDVKVIGINQSDPGNPNDIFTWYVNNVIVEGPVQQSIDDKLDYTFPGDGMYTIKLRITNGFNCGTFERVVNVTDCDNDPPNCCDIDADFSYSVSNCTNYSFTGINNGTECPTQQYQWKIDGTVVSNSQNLNYNFGYGSYQVCLTITNNSFDVRDCIDTYCQTINTSPDCPSNGIIVNNAECTSNGGGDASANWQVNVCDVDFITWSYSIGPHVDQPLWNTYGNAIGMHQVNFNLPNRPSGTWHNFILVVKGQATLLDGTVCNEVYNTVTLVCPGGGGGTGGNQKGAESKFSIYPNPADISFEISSNGDHVAQKVLIKDLFGKIVKQDVNIEAEVNVSSLTKGIYIVEILLEDGSMITKKLLIK
ncbi:MAG: T9SS type A sorting domain-containing protein [Bacteroidota bacterium]